MGDYSPGDNTSNLANAIRGLKTFYGLCVVLGGTRRDILPLLKGRSRPAETDDDYAAYCKSNEDLYAILYRLVELPASLSVQKHEDDSKISGDGQAAFQELNLNYNKVTDEVIRATMEELINTPMEPRQNPDDYFNQKHLLRHKAEKMGETISDCYFNDECVTGFTNEYKDVKMIMYRDPDFNVDKMQTTMRHMFLDEQSRNGPKGSIAGRGFAMTATTSEEPTCFDCGEKGHIWRNCSEKRGKGKKKTKPAGAAKWCSVHFTTRHSDEECFEQGATRPKKSSNTGKALSACASCTHCFSTSNKTELAMTKQEASSTQAEIDFSAEGESEEGFMYAIVHKGEDLKPMATGATPLGASSTNAEIDLSADGESEEAFMYATAHEGGELKPNAAGATLLIDTGASENMLDDCLIPGLKEIMREHKELAKPKVVSVRGDHELDGNATGLIHCTVKDSNGEKQAVLLRGIVVPGLGRNVFSSTAQIKNGVKLVIEEGNPHLAVGGHTLPLKQDPRDDPDAAQAKSIAAPKLTQGKTRPLEATHAATRRRPNASDSIEPSLAPSSLEVSMDLSGNGCMTATMMRPDPSAPTHPIQQGFLEEEPIKIPNTSKQKPDEKIKVKLVVQWYVQESGIDYGRSYAQESCIDYGRSYAPVCDIGSVRTFLAIASEQRWPVYPMDATVAFLQSAIDKDVRVKPDPGQDTKHPAAGDIMVYQLENCNPVGTPGYGPEVSTDQPADKLSGAAYTKPYQCITGSVAGNAMLSSWTKHIALRFSFQRELVKRNKISIHHKESQAMLADVATKHLSRQQFISLLDHIKNFTC
ncbi:unnamed protein product [Ectocarpus sp. CCAP 1310/34]|nr:unnamed protein product [Ectocarpus sp. CCAP 1310/34]